mmetsp:Transcript_9265/g.17714  ORF Transcript_9265/g.17714 Transcript_9265/m.17714 type:complete len:991 (-) Transcript_9265:928-3900(-)
MLMDQKPHRLESNGHVSADNAMQISHKTALSLHTEKRKLGNPSCACGCDDKFLFRFRVPRKKFKLPEDNFKALLGVFLKQLSESDLADILTYEPLVGMLSIYDLFHAALTCKTAGGGVDWKRVAGCMAQKSPNVEGSVLKRAYSSLLNRFQKWLRDTCPAKVLLIGQEVNIIVSKALLKSKPCCNPNFEDIPIKKQKTSDTPSTAASSPVIKTVYLSPFRDLTLTKPAFELAQSAESQEESPLFKIPFKKPLNLTPEEPTPAIEVKSKEPTKEVAKPDKKNSYGKRGRPSYEVVQQKISAIKIPNPMNPDLRLLDPTDLKFSTNFRSGYLPIEMQEEQEAQERNHKESKTHFIRKKQSNLNIKRCCGVTYTQPTESKQVGVEGVPPLPPLAFQVGTLERCALSLEEEVRVLFEAEKLIDSLFNGLDFCSVSVLEDCGEESIKRYLLAREGETKQFLVQDLSQLWRLINDGAFVAIHLWSSANNVFELALPGEAGDVIIGFSVRKALCGLKSVKKSLGFEVNESDKMNVHTHALRLELYLTKTLWTIASPPMRALLCAFITAFEVRFNKFMCTWICIREGVFNSKQIQPYTGIHRMIKDCDCSFTPPPTSPVLLWSYEKIGESSHRTAIFCKVCGSCIVETDFWAGLAPLKLSTSKQPPYWLYLINTRDSFSYDLIVKETELEAGSRKFVKKEYFFDQADIPKSFKEWKEYLNEDGLVKVGVTTYEGFFAESELKVMEGYARDTEEQFLNGAFLANTAQPTYGAGGHIKRTKFFFGLRYMWSACQLAERHSSVAAGVRLDVSRPAPWMRDCLEAPLVEGGILEANFINSFAMNIYHDGTEGLAQHFDDAVRFKQPIYTVKLGSDSRLSFGSQFYGFCNGAFSVPCPRGCICVLEEFSFAANGAKHCVRPCDLSGRSITMILRQIHPKIYKEAVRYDLEVDLPTWFSCLSLDDEAVSYAEQKNLEGQQLKMNAAKKPRDEVKEWLHDLLARL